MLTGHSFRFVVLTSAAAAIGLIGGSACIGTSTTGDGGPSSEKRTFNLDQMKTASLEINGQTFRAWLALDAAQRAEGLMHVPEEEIADDQGMLFVFSDERLLSFWMKDTITALDIAFARMNGEIVKIHTMPPLTLLGFPSIEPAMFALEVKAGTFDRLGIREGDVIIIPEEVFKATP